MAQDHHTLSDTLGQNVAGQVWITLRPDTPAGIELGGGRCLGPGETGRLPRALADRLVRNGKASYAEPPAPPAPTVPNAVETADPTPAVRSSTRGARRR